MADDTDIPAALDAPTFEALHQSLSTFRKKCGSQEQRMVDVFLHMLSDPIERMKLQAPSSSHFDDEEEAYLAQMEIENKRLK